MPAAPLLTRPTSRVERIWGAASGCVEKGKATVIIAISLVILAVGIYGAHDLRVGDYGIDPLSILVPFLIFSIGVSHAVQMSKTWEREVIAGTDSLTAAKRAFARLFIPGTFALLTNVLGFAVIMVIPIDIVRELGITASLGVAWMIVTNKMLLPILLSHLHIAKTAASKDAYQESRIERVWQAARMKKPKGESASVEGTLTKPETASPGSSESVPDENTEGMDAEMPDLNQQPVDEPDAPADKVTRESSEEGKGKDKPIDQDPNLGRVEGRILHSGKPLPNCQVKLQMLEKGGLLAKGYRPLEGALEIEVTTNNEGVYQFMNVAPGLYKMYWKPPSETAWVRRFKMEPDVVVNSGRLTKPKDIETLKRTLN